MKFTFRKEEKLKSKKLIEKLFAEGEHVKSFPLRMIYVKADHDYEKIFQVGVSVSKRNFKKAVDRNRIKRLMREAYRLNKHLLEKEITEKYVCMFIYTGRDEWKYAELESKMVKVMHKFIEKVNSEKSSS
ncbi:ribonuclease P protein component [Aureivirga sp. CE67]|uniref:ribonuclease P protein component n=1 Tax=Aureivirga sp. CE67 TaxID=1788983 RepID=UPI0018CBB636|nr:ribonuclease P protein component [Aureivirga sp. CE67]